MKRIILKLIVLIFIIVINISCKNNKRESDSIEPLYSKVAKSVVFNNPKAWMVDFDSKPKWGYVQGLVGQSLVAVSQKTGNPCFLEYVKDTYIDELLDTIGNIKRYKMLSYKLDDINSGKLLFDLYKLTNDKKYLKGIHNLYKQIMNQPRTDEGGFWHKKVYANQMWLDGQYMVLPFYAEYASYYKKEKDYDDIVNQYKIIESSLKDNKTGLYYHGWDSSKTIFWSNPKTGVSSNFWGRGVGWLYMSLIDVLEFMPKTYKKRHVLEQMFKDLTIAILNVQDEKTHVWYQILDLPSREGNYLEATCSTMFLYGLCKGVELGVLDKVYIKSIKETYLGIQKTFITESNGIFKINACCAGAGLGPKDNLVRDGSFNYYIGESIRSNDGKAIGPLIMSSIIINNNSDWKIQ